MGGRVTEERSETGGLAQADLLDLPFLRRLRAMELDALSALLPAGDRVLELGAGEGLQSRLLQERGLRVVPVEVRGSLYERHRVLPMTLYDGARLPFRDQVFDLVYSSNVLEHVVDLESLLRETHRVLRPDGVALHVLPTSTWRLWTSLTHYAALGARLWRELRQDRPAERALGRWRWLRRQVGRTAHLLWSKAGPVRHGEHGTAWSELWLFGRRRWRQVLQEGGFEVLSTPTLGLFYTGHMVLAGRLSLRWRRVLAHGLGSSTRLYVARSTRPMPAEEAPCSGGYTSASRGGRI